MSNIRATSKSFGILLLLCLVLYFLFEVVSLHFIIRSAKRVPDEEDFQLGQFTSIYNLPSVTTNLDPPAISDSSSCTQPVRIGPGQTCLEVCGNSSASSFQVDKDELYLAQTLLPAGTYCSLNPPEPCSALWGISVASVDGWECIARFPDAIGGKSAAVPNISFYEDGQFLGGNKLLVDGRPLDTNTETYDFKERSNVEVVCADTIDGFKMTQLPHALKCVRDPCESIPGTDSFWDGQRCVCGINQTHRVPGDELSECVGANYIEPGYDPITTTQYEIVDCTSLASPYTGGIVNICPNLANQASTVGTVSYRFAEHGQVVPYPDSGWVASV